ncbi:GatB/YqeY domain-containing protein [Thermobifida halotolerans]|uniref:GatB/YqeY domain-containing protein n=1 Tax=Thermobifida halotolerans TaxID=483545 RepID=A0A399FUV3_9ACTN|nr:GatB/YqeY domain-containing protein [Thermobifida halotolerans]UOE19177.1 GatB/YqeY domain-containing protein [Thermobifida halotolerans]
MAELKTRLQADLTSAMKARDRVRTRTLRMVLTAISNEEVAGESARELSDDDVIKVITREAKKRREAAEAFEQGGRSDKAADERAEGEVLASYLPAQLSDEELAALVREAIAEAGVSDVKGMGKVMKILTPKTSGRADGRRVADEVRRQLA